MIVVKINILQFEYDIHSLVKAFYPEADIKVVLFEESSSFTSEGSTFEIYFSDHEIVMKAQNVNEKTDEDAIHRGDQHEGYGNKKNEEHVEQCIGKSLERRVTLTEPENRPMVKNQLKQLIYQTLSKFTGKELPWGTLTGIRPTKIPMTLLEEGKTDQEIMEYMQDTYFISDEKGHLSLDIARRERNLLSNIHYKDGYSLYIGIPFCPTTCLYCSFTSYPICSWKKRVDEYLDAVEKEIDFVADIYRDKILDSVYIGGGTPTTLEAEQFDRLLGKINSSFDFKEVKEYTVEAGRADSITREKLQALKRNGVTRISVNPQTMKDETLKLIGRQHTVAQAVEAFHMAREEGFTNINMDLILGLPGEDEEDVKHTVAAVKELKPDSLTVHSLAIKRASRLHQWIQEHGITTLKNTDTTMEIAAQGAADMGMVPYYLYRQKNMSGNFENVGYATEGNFGIYNILMMEEMQSIVALGAGSVSKLVLGDGRIERTDNVKDVGLYIEKIDEMINRKRKLFSVK
ncbi:MAG: coproporphyrinogen dehydrogenase HemZ [Lachnospiraceae bacterium]|nr:coproporphyrinogen dehydrogenase HemZ [Lachnospiraceae bacterium]